MTPVRLVQLIDANDVKLDGSIDSTGYGPYDFKAADDPRTYADLVTPAGLAEIATYADGLGPWKRYVIGARGHRRRWQPGRRRRQRRPAVNDADRTATPPTSLLRDARQAGLFVHAYTWRNERSFLLADYGDDPLQEYLHFYCLGVDGVFSDNPDTALTARALFWGNPGAACAPWRP